MNKTKNKTIAIGMGYCNIIVHNLVSFVLTPIMIAIWGDASYGIYKIILSLMTYFMLIDSGVKNTVVRFVSEYRAGNNKDGERRYVATITTFYLIASCLLAIIVFLFSMAIPNLYSSALTPKEIDIMLASLPWLTFYTIGTLFFNCFTALLRGHNKQIIVQSINIVRSLVRFIVIFMMLRSGLEVTEVIAADALITLGFAAFVVFIVFAFLKLPPKWEGINKAFINKIIGFTGVMLVYTVANSLFWSVGNFLVGVMTSSLHAAIYTTAITLTNMFQSLSNTISQVLVPDIMVKSFTTDNMDEMNALMIRVGKLKMSVMLLVLIGFGVFGSEFVFLWVGETYRDTYMIAFLTMIPLFLGMLQDVPSNYLLSKNKHRVMAVITVIAASFNAVFSFTMIPIFGLYGAAVGTLISYTLIYVVFTFFYYTKEFGFDMKLLYKETILKSIVPIAFLVGVGLLINTLSAAIWVGEHLMNGWLRLIVKIIIFTATYFIVFITSILAKRNMRSLPLK